MQAKKPRPQTSGEGCQYLREDGSPCGEPLTGKARRYCELHKEAGRKQYKAIVQKKGQYVEEYREKRRTLQEYYGDDEYQRQNSNHQFRHRHGLTEPKLKRFLDRAETRQEYCHRSKDDVYEYALRKLNEIKRLILNPPADLPSAAVIAKKEAEALLEYLEEKQRDSLHDSVIKRFIFYCKELQRDVGQRMSSKAFTNIGSKAKLVREMCHEQRVLLSLGYAHLVDVEIARIKFFAFPHKQQYFENKALTELSGALGVSDFALQSYTGEQKQMAYFLRCYADLVRVRLAFDAGELGEAATHLQAAHQRVAAFADAYSTGQVVATLRFVSSMHHAEHQLRDRNFDRSSEYLEEAEQIFSTMEWRSIESHHRIAIVKTQLALATNDPEYQKYLQHYISVIHRYRCFEYRHGLRELKRAYPKKVPNVNLLKLKDNSLFVDTTFTHILPYVFDL